MSWDLNGNKEETVKTIKLEMGWDGYMRSLIMLMELGDDEGKSFAKSELMRLAKFLKKSDIINKF